MKKKNLPSCLTQLSEFDEVFIIDSGSTDRTPEIVKDFGYTLVNFEWNGKFPKKRNWALRNLSFRNDWILFLDADEQVTSEFIKEVSLKILSTDDVGFLISYHNFFHGKETSVWR
ncbi:glycosyltransferase [Algoriphagus boritolerans]|uniref:glycosyltransferase n=1 Tax=Algoriphagus boritolerans TaxID=308111 RepID=UPI000AE7AD16